MRTAHRTYLCLLVYIKDIVKDISEQQLGEEVHRVRSGKFQVEELLHPWSWSDHPLAHGCVHQSEPLKTS